MLALLILSIVAVALPFVHAVLADARERRRRERAQDRSEYDFILGADNDL